MIESPEPDKLLEIILRIGTCVPRTMDLDHFLDVVTDELVKGIALEAAGVLLPDEDLGDFRWRQISDPKCLLRENGSERPGIRDQMAIDCALETGEPVLTNRTGIAAIPGDCRDEQEKPENLDKLYVPLPTRDSIVGLLVLIKTGSQDFTKAEIDTMVGIAGILAISVENGVYAGEISDAYRKASALERMKTKITNRLSHELRTPLAILKASLKYLEVGLGEFGMRKFDSALARMHRQVENLGYLERQVWSILKTGVYEERDMLARLLESAASLMELRSEQKPEIRFDAALILRILEEAFPDHNNQVRRIDIKEFCESMLEEVRNKMALQSRQLTLALDLVGGTEICIPDLVLHSTIEGIIRNAVEATPDKGFVEIRGRIDGGFYVITVEDSGVGIPAEDWGLVFDGFYQVQETEDYTSGRPYSFNAGGKGMDLFRIKMFAKMHGLGLYFRSRRCRHLIESLKECPGDIGSCPYCGSLKDCTNSGGTVFEIDLPMAAN